MIYSDSYVHVFTQLAPYSSFSNLQKTGKQQKCIFFQRCLWFIRFFVVLSHFNNQTGVGKCIKTIKYLYSIIFQHGLHNTHKTTLKLFKSLHNLGKRAKKWRTAPCSLFTSKLRATANNWIPFHTTPPLRGHVYIWNNIKAGYVIGSCKLGWSTNCKEQKLLRVLNNIVVYYFWLDIMFSKKTKTWGVSDLEFQGTAPSYIIHLDVSKIITRTNAAVSESGKNDFLIIMGQMLKTQVRSIILYITDPIFNSNLKNMFNFFWRITYCSLNII